MLHSLERRTHKSWKYENIATKMQHSLERWLAGRLEGDGNNQELICRGRTRRSFTGHKMKDEKREGIDLRLWSVNMFDHFLSELIWKGRGKNID